MSHILRVPRLNSNEDEYELTSRYVESGEHVEAGTVVATLESSKVAEELEAPTTGFLRWVGSPNRVSVGDALAVVGDSDAETIGIVEALNGPEGRSNDTVTLSRDAASYAREMGISQEALSSLGLRFVMKRDLEPLSPRLGSDPRARVQDGVTSTVIQAAMTPRAFSAALVSAERALSLAAEASNAGGLPVGLPEVVVHTIGLSLDSQRGVWDRTGGKQPLDFGVTIDTGTGLYVPVIRDLASLSLGDVTRIMWEFRIKAMRRSFRSSDLEGATFSLSLNMAEGVVLTEPLVIPGSIGTFSLSSAFPFTAYEERAGASHILLGLSYDHRSLNGREAGILLSEVRAKLLAVT